MCRALLAATLIICSGLFEVPLATRNIFSCVAKSWKGQNWRGVPRTPQHVEKIQSLTDLLRLIARLRLYNCCQVERFVRGKVWHNSRQETTSCHDVLFDLAVLTLYEQRDKTICVLGVLKSRNPTPEPETRNLEPIYAAGRRGHHTQSHLWCSLDSWLDFNICQPLLTFFSCCCGFRSGLLLSAAAFTPTCAFHWP